MSAAKRWKMTVAYSTPSKTPHTRAVSNTKGDWVKWEDYAALLTTNERLRKGDDSLALTAYLYAHELASTDRKNLKAEIEKLKSTLTQLQAYEQMTGIKLEKIEAKTK